jgi:ElaA protein
VVVPDHPEALGAKTIAEPLLPEQELTPQTVHEQHHGIARIPEGLMAEVDARRQFGDFHDPIFGCQRRAGKPGGASVADVTDIHDHRFRDLDPMTFHDLLRLRIDVFVVEQECAYAELDGRDTEPDTRHIWLDGTSGPMAYLRVLVEPGGASRIGRVATLAAARGNGLAGVLLDHVHATTPDPLVMDAQTYLVPWYTSMGYQRSGPEFIEDGIAHVPMTREPTGD